MKKQISRFILWPFKLLGLLLGTLSWAPPPWLYRISGYRRKRPVVFWLATGLILMVICGYGTWLMMPKPLMVDGTVIVPGITPNVENSVPDVLQITFDYDRKGADPSLVVPDTLPSVARIDLVNQKIPSGITLEPPMPGAWMWQGGPSAGIYAGKRVGAGNFLPDPRRQNGFCRPCKIKAQ